MHLVFLAVVDCGCGLLCLYRGCAPPSLMKIHSLVNSAQTLNTEYGKGANTTVHPPPQSHRPLPPNANVHPHHLAVLSVLHSIKQDCLQSARYHETGAFPASGNHTASVPGLFGLPNSPLKSTLLSRSLVSPRRTSRQLSIQRLPSSRLQSNRRQAKLHVIRLADPRPTIVALEPSSSQQPFVSEHSTT